jgi:two-component system chemotaxis sensor kinase CheA
MDDFQDPELLAEFVSESLNGLRDTEQDLLSLEGDGEVDVELVNRIFRAVHSIKGSASFMGLDNLVKVAHRGETLLDMLRSGKARPTSEITDAVLAGNDALTCMLEEPDLGSSYDSTDVLAKLDLVLAALQGIDSDASESPSAGQTSEGESVVSGASSHSATESTLTFLRENVEVHNHLAVLRVDLAELHHNIDTKEGVLDGLNSVGKVVHATIPVDQINRTESGTCVIFFDTILEPDLISMHFGIPMEDIVVLDLKNPECQLPFPKELGQGNSQASESTPNGAADPSSSESSSDQASRPGGSTPVQAKPSVPANSSVPAKSNAPAKKASAAEQTEQTMRVPVRILQELLKWTGNMVMARNQLMHEFDFSGSTAFHTLSQAITGVHETVIATRMQTTGTLFERYRRVVRDLSRQLGKEIAFHIEGGDLELDRTILEGFADPLTHLVRNCCDHALETPEEREANGKNRQGNVYLRSYVQSGEIILEVKDDGRGIPADIICRKAIEKGVISPEEAEAMTEDQKIMLIFSPGFSTKEQATDVSGRGVGMDVVRNNIEKVGGTIEVKTKLGEGSVFAARLPLAKALVASSLTAALIVEVDGEKFAVPETAVSEIIRCDHQTAGRIHQVDGREVYQLREQLVALVDLRVPLELAEESSFSGPDRLLNIKPGDSRCLVILQYRNHLFGTIVDNVVGIQEIIVSSTPKLLENCTVYSGHTVLGTGRVALILDVNGIVNKMELEFSQRALRKNNAIAGRQESLDDTATQKMLLFNYAPKEYFAIPLELVALIERISTKDLQTVGQKEFIQFKSETISVMRLSNFLPISEIDPSQEEFCLIRPSAVEYPIGILTGLDVSVLEVAETFETRLDDSQGVVGTFMHEDRLVMMLDLFGIFEKHAPEKLRIEDDSNSPATILIAEDSLFFRKLIAQYIQKPEWTVDIVNDGQEAWEKLQKNPSRYDLIISDINMPRMDGFEFASHVRDDPRFDRLPLVALTTMADEHFRKKGLALGFDRYVIKIDKREVRATVADCLKIKREPK